MTAAPPAQRGPVRAGRFWRWVLIVYVVGFALDVAWHVHVGLTTGDREIELYEWLYGLQASLFWPLDLLAQAMLALR